MCPHTYLLLMKNISRLLALLLTLAALAVVNDAFAETALSQKLAHCAGLSNDRARLACYDELARDHSPDINKPRVLKFIQPPATFLDSHLVAEPWKAEYTLTVRSFVDLISQAVMEDKKHVTVHGWSRDKHGYILHITMKKPVELHFLRREPAKGAMSMSLLRDVKMDGYTLGADQFIMIIATMVPDKKTD